MRNLCDEAGLQQLVREPTRGKLLLDLALTDIDDVKCKVLTKVADHKGLGITLTLPVPLVATPVRRVWQYRDADWDGLREALNSQDWSWLKHVDAHVGAERLTDNILDPSRQFIPERFLHERKRTHPWINDRVLELVRAKRVAEGTALRWVENSVAKEFLTNFTTTSRKSAGPCRTCGAALKDGGQDRVYKKRELCSAFLLCAILWAGGFSRPKKKPTCLLAHWRRNLSFSQRCRTITPGLTRRQGMAKDL